MNAFESYPLTSLQQGMLYHGLQEHRVGVDIEQILCELREPLAIPAFRQAWEMVTARHTILRTSFCWEDGDEPRQVVHPVVPLPWVELDWHGHSAMEVQDHLDALRKEDRAQRFDFTKPPLMRFTLMRVGEADFRWLWTFHHILLDGRSFPIVLQEVFQVYEAMGGGEQPVLPPARPFREYIDWRASQNFDGSAAYWRELLKGFHTPTPFAVDHDPSRAPALPSDYQEREMRLTAAETGILLTWAKSNELTLNTLLQAAWAILLSRYSGEDDVVFGGTRACRNTGLAGTDTMVGLFINTLPVRANAEGSQPLLPWLRQLRAQWIAMRPHEHTPLAKVRAWSQVPKGRDLFDSIVVFENFLLNSRLRTLGGVWQNRTFDYFGQTNFALTVMGYQDAELIVRIGYDRQRFDDEAIIRMLGHLRTLLLAMPAAEGKRICDLPMLPEAERRELLFDRNVTTTFPADVCLHSWFEAQARQRPDAIAVTTEQEEITYGELNARANQLAHHLRACGVGADCLVALCLERTVDLIVAILGVLKAGGAYVPLDLAYPPERIAFMIQDAGACVLLTQAALRDRLPRSADVRVVCLDADWAEISQASAQNPTVAVGPENLAYVIYTSGSTGKPKGCLVTHANVVRLFRATDAWFGFGPQDVWTLFHSYAFDFSVWEIWGALLYGGRLVVVPYVTSRSPEAFYELLAREKVTVLNQTPSAFRQLVQAEETATPRALALRYVIFGGEALEMQSLQPWFARHGDARPQLVNMYGITETTVHVTYRPLTKADVGRGSVIGEPIPDLQLFLLDPRGEPVPVGVPGELHVGGAGLARGYLHRPELTAARFIPSPFSAEPGARLYRTGDLARRLPDGEIEYLGRCDQQVKIRGFRIELGEIESMLGQHPQVRAAVVLAREDVPGDKRLFAYIESAGPPPAASALREHLKPRLPDYMLPAGFMFLDALPLTENGKINRRALPAPELKRDEAINPYAAPRTPLEEKLASIWACVLRVERVSVHDNFFDLGGDSLILVQLHARLRKALQSDLSIVKLFEFPTIRSLARHLEQPASVAGANGNTKNLQDRAQRQREALSRMRTAAKR